MRKRTIILPGGVSTVKHSVKCDITGCRRRKRGYLSTFGSGEFYDKKGHLLANLREVHFVCSEHGIADGSAPFLYRDEGIK